MQDFDTDVDSYDDYSTFMSTVFKLLGANSSFSALDDEVKKIDELEDDFAKVIEI